MLVDRGAEIEAEYIVSMHENNNNNNNAPDGRITDSRANGRAADACVCARTEWHDAAALGRVQRRRPRGSDAHRSRRRGRITYQGEMRPRFRG